MKRFLRKFFEKYGECALVSSFAVFVFLFLLADRLVWMSDVGSFNVNGWIGFFHDFVPLYFILLAPLFLLGRHAKCFYLPFFTVELVLLLIGWFARCNFNMVIDGDWIGIVLGSSVDEMLWFARHYATLPLFLLILLFFGLVIGVWRLTCAACRSRVTKTSVAMGLGAILLFFYANHILHSYVFKQYKTLEKQIFGVNLVIDSFRQWDNFKMLATLKNAPQMPKTIKLSHEMTDDVIGVVVLGESATRSHLGLYGYGRDTTPCMDARKSELVIFEDLVTPIGSTAEAMRYTFTTRTVERQNDLRFNMAQCLKSVGYDVAMFSNQERWGEWDGDESFDFAGCDPFFFMKEQGETNTYDEVLIPYCAKYLKEAHRKAIVFLHLKGSHAPASSQYPHEGAPFEPEKFAHSGDSSNPVLSKNHYDNSIWYTDKILERIIRELESTHKPTWLIYFSDHGETPSSKGWRMQADNDLWEIPFIVWTSKEFQEAFPEKVKSLKAATKRALQSDQLLYGMLSFCGVEGLGNDPEEDFLNPAFKCRKNRLVQNGRAEYVQRAKSGE